MRKAVLAVVVALATAPLTYVAAQDRAAIPRSEIDPRLLNLPIRSADGQLVGVVLTQAGNRDGKAVLIGEVERPLGLGPELIAISADMFVDRGDHIQLTLTADQIREKLAKAKQ